MTKADAQADIRRRLDWIIGEADILRGYFHDKREPYAARRRFRAFDRKARECLLELDEMVEALAKPEEKP